MGVIFSIFVLLFCIVCACSRADTDEISLAGAAGHDLQGKKVLVVDSYHPEYLKSMFIVKEVEKFAYKEGIQLEVVYLDAKHKKDDASLRQAADHVKKFIESWHPDLVIAADDPANTYLVAPYYRDSPLPFVFVGVNWNIVQYGYPCKNVTGQIEVEFPVELIRELRRYAAGSRIGFLTGETLTDRKVCNYYEHDLKITFFKKVFVNTFQEWKSQYIALQNDVDILFVRNNGGIDGWNDAEAYDFVIENTRVPTGSVAQVMAPFVLIDYSKVNLEFGQYAVQTARTILSGTPPSQIPITRNKQLQVYLNMPLAKKLNILFPMSLIEQATFVRDGFVYENNNN